MHVKVDFSEDCKAHGNDVSRPGAYAIYTRKHRWNKWIQVGSGYADLEMCKSDARRAADLPIYYR